MHIANMTFYFSQHPPDNVDEEMLATAGLSPEELENIQPVFPVEHDDNLVLADTRVWVNRLIADFGVCPFTADADRAGIPMGGLVSFFLFFFVVSFSTTLPLPLPTLALTLLLPYPSNFHLIQNLQIILFILRVRYTVSRAKNCDQAFLAYWKEVQALLSVPERDISTVLLVFPEFDLFGNYEVFENYCDSLSDSLSCSSLALEDEVQLVFFHPQYSFRDGNARAGLESGAANFARRSPWPMINLLRTPQVSNIKSLLQTTPVNLNHFKNKNLNFIFRYGQRKREFLQVPCISKTRID